MSISIHIPTPLRPYTGGLATVDVSQYCGRGLDSIDQRSPDHLVIYGMNESIRSFVNVYLGDEDIRFQQNERRPFPRVLSSPLCLRLRVVLDEFAG